ncbi:MAG: dihydrouridine synthase [Planctomyces sp.]|nr:dihydrouridine synthase [Planctomyces sp.]
MRIGNVSIAHGLTLAPMEEHTSLPFRLIMKQHGASLVCSERIDGCDVASRDKRAMKLLATTAGERPAVGQISGGEPQEIAEAARVIQELGFAIVDLNFECPIKRLVGRGEGGALMAQPARIAELVAAAAKVVDIPVTVKLRTGPKAGEDTAIETAQRVEQAGGAGITLHARSVEQAYLGGPDWTHVTRVKEAVSIPVLGSGGIRTAADAIAFLKESGADGAAIGRGCLGNPWIFQQARSLLLGGGAVAEPSPAERGKVLLSLVEHEFEFYGPHLATRRLPRTACYFAKFLPTFGEFKKEIQTIKNLPQFRQLVRERFR